MEKIVKGPSTSTHKKMKKTKGFDDSHGISGNESLVSSVNSYCYRLCIDINLMNSSLPDILLSFIRIHSYYANCSYLIKKPLQI